MKKFLSHTKTAVILLLVTVLFLGFYTYMLVRPISYGMGYHNETVYEGEEFKGSLKFYPNGKVVNKNSNLNEEFEFYYYYKNGYVFSLMAQTEEEYQAEAAYIDQNFDEAVASPFYASKINVFENYAEGPDGYSVTYTCTGAIIFAAAGGVAALAFVALTVASFVISKKAKSKE